MLTQTSVTAVRLLVHLGVEAKGEVTSLKQVAERLQVSPTYLVKIARHLVRAGLLRASRGKTGGVILNRAPKDITLLDIAEACQGTILGDFCQAKEDLGTMCALHQAGVELHEAITGTMRQWTLADFIRRPQPAEGVRRRVKCLMEGGRR